MHTHIKPTETFQKYTLHLLPPSRRQERLYQKANKTEQIITQFKRRLRDRGYPDNLLENTLSEIKFTESKESRLYKINKNHAKEFCRLLQNIARLCLILKTFL